MVQHLAASSVDGGSMFLGNSELKYAKLVNDTDNRMANGDIILAKAGVKDGSATYNYADSTDATLLKLLNYEIGEMTVNGQNGATYALLDCNKLDPSGNAVRFRLYDNDSKSSYPFAKYSMNYNVELAIPIIDRYNQTYNGVNFSGLTISDKYTSYRFDNAITQPGNYVDIALANNLQNKPVTLWNYAVNPEEVYSGELHKNILWNTSQVVPQTVKDCPFYINTIYKMKLSRGNGYACSGTSEVTADNGGSLLGRTTVSTDKTYVRATVKAEYSQFANRAQTLVFDSWDLAIPKPTIPKNDPVTPPGGTDPSTPGGTPDPGRDEGGTPGAIEGINAATVQGHAIKVTEAHGYADIDFSFTGGQNFADNAFQYTFDREKCYVTSKRNDCTTQIQVNLARFRTGEQANCMTTYYPYEVHLYNGTTGKDYNAGDNLFATGDKELPYLYVGVLNNYRTYLKNTGNINAAFTLYVNNTREDNQTSHSGLVTKGNDASGRAYFQTANNSTYQSPTSYAFGVTLTDEYSYTANMRTDGHAGSKDGATFSGIQFSGGDLNATSDTDHEFYTYRFDNLINGIMQGETRPFHRTKDGVGTFPMRAGSVVLALNGLSITDWADKEDLIPKFYTDEARPSVFVNQLYKFSMLKGYAYEGLVVSGRPARESSANMVHVGLTTCDSCSIVFNGTGATANLSDVKIYCALHDPAKAWTLADRGTDNRHAGYKASGGWKLFAARWSKYMKGTLDNMPIFADYNVVSAHQPGVIYYYENMLNNITEEFTGAQTRTTSYTAIPNETYNVNEFFSDKASDNGGNPVSLTIQYPRFANRTKTVSFDVKTIGTAEFRPEKEKTGPDPDNPDPDNPESGGKILRNYVGRELYIDLKTVSEPDLTNSLVTITYNTGTGDDAFQMNRRNDRNEWFTDESRFYIKEVNRIQGTDGWWTTSFAITTAENVDTMDVAVTFNGVKCKITNSDSTTADITTTNTGNYFSYSVNAYNASTTDVNFAWNMQAGDYDDSIGFRGDWEKTDIVELIYKPGDRARKSELTEFNGQLAGTDKSSFVPYALKTANTGIGAPGAISSDAKSVTRVNVDSWGPSSADTDLVLQSCGTNGYKIISNKLSAIYAQVKPEDPHALKKMNDKLASPDITIWHTAYYFNPGGSTRFTKDDTEQADFDETVQILEVGKKYTLGHTKNTGKAVSTHYAFKWRLIDGESATKTAQIETLTAHAQALDNTGAVVGENNSWHFNNWGSAFATGKLLGPIYANSNSNTLYVQYPKFANRTGAITYKIEGASFVPFNATLKIGEGHCAVVDLSEVGGEAGKKNAYFTLDGATTVKDISFDTSLVKSISVKLSSGTTTSTYDTGSFEDKLDKLNKWSSDGNGNGKSYGIGAFYYKDGKLYFTGRKDGSYKQIDITITSTDGKEIKLTFNNMEFVDSVGVFLKYTDKDAYFVNKTYSINRGDTILYTLARDRSDLFNAAYRVGMSSAFIEKISQSNYKIDTGTHDDDNQHTTGYIDLLGIPEGRRDDWVDYIKDLRELNKKNGETDKYTIASVSGVSFKSIAQTGTNWSTGDSKITNPTTGYKASGDTNQVEMQKIFIDPTGTGTSTYVSVKLNETNAVVVEIPDTSYIPNNARSKFAFEMKDYPLAEELGDKGFIKQCQALYNSLSNTDYYGSFDNRSTDTTTPYKTNVSVKEIGIANNLYLQAESSMNGTDVADATKDKAFDSTRIRAINIVQEAAHNANGQNAADLKNAGDSEADQKDVADAVTDLHLTDKINHFHFNNKTGTFSETNTSWGYPVKCLKGASSITLTKGLLNMYTTRYNDSVLVSQPNNESAVNALDFLKTSGTIKANESTFTIFSSAQLIQSGTYGDEASNHGITIRNILKQGGYNGKGREATISASTTMITLANGKVSSATTGGDKALTKLTTDTLDEKISTNYIMYDMTLKKTKFGSKQVAVFQTTKAGAGFKLTLDSTITGSAVYNSGTLGGLKNTYTSGTNDVSDKTPELEQSQAQKVSSDYANANAYPNGFRATRLYNYQINEAMGAWVTSETDKDANNNKITANCRITFTDDDPSTTRDNPTAFMPYKVGSASNEYNNKITVWSSEGSSNSSCCMLDIDSVVDNLVDDYEDKTIRYIDTYIDVCYNNNGFRQVRYPVRLVLDQKVE